MASKNKKEFNTGKSIAILFLYLVLWWILMTLVNLLSGVDETDLLYHVIEFLRVSVPVFALLFGIPIVLIVGNNKTKRKNKK